MTHLYEYEVRFGDDRDAEIVESTMPPNAIDEEIRELFPEADDSTRVTYVGRVA